MAKGKVDYDNWQKGKKITRMQSMRAFCYMCNGEDESAVDCSGKKSCPMYEYFYYKKSY